MGGGKKNAEKGEQEEKYSYMFKMPKIKLFLGSLRGPSLDSSLIQIMPSFLPSCLSLTQFIFLLLLSGRTGSLPPPPATIAAAPAGGKLSAPLSKSGANPALAAAGAFDNGASPLRSSSPPSLPPRAVPFYASPPPPP